MTIIAALAQPVTIRTITETDVNGIPTDQVTAETPAELAIMQTASVEVTIGESTVISDWAGFADDPTLAITHKDQIVDDAGTVYEVVGQPERPRTPRGQHHIELRLRVIS